MPQGEDEQVAEFAKSLGFSWEILCIRNSWRLPLLRTPTLGAYTASPRWGTEFQENLLFERPDGHDFGFTSS